MKKSFLSLFGILLLAGAAVAGPRVGVFVNFGGGYCGPRPYVAPAYYAPRVVYTPVRCYTAPMAYAPVYRAPIVMTGMMVSPVAFGWRR